MNDYLVMKLMGVIALLISISTQVYSHGVHHDVNEMDIIKPMKMELRLDKSSKAINLQIRIMNNEAYDLCYNKHTFPYQEHKPPHMAHNVFTILAENGELFWWGVVDDRDLVKEDIKRFLQGNVLEVIFPLFGEYTKPPIGRIKIIYYLHMVACNNSLKPESTYSNHSIYSDIKSGENLRVGHMNSNYEVIYHGKVTLNPEDWLHSDQVRRSNPELVKSQ